MSSTEEGHKKPQEHLTQREHVSLDCGWVRQDVVKWASQGEYSWDLTREMKVGIQTKQVGTAAPSQVLCLSCSWDQSPSTCGGMLKHSLTQTFQDQKLWEIPQTTDKHCWKARKAQKAAGEKQLELEGTASTTATWVWATHKCGTTGTLTANLTLAPPGFPSAQNL